MEKIHPVILSIVEGVADVHCRLSATVLKSGKEGQYEKEGYGQVDIQATSHKRFSCSWRSIHQEIDRLHALGDHFRRPDYPPYCSCTLSTVFFCRGPMTTGTKLCLIARVRTLAR